mgnify:CR=1 FL=1
MSKARTLANLISDNAELADGQISVAEVVGAAPTANPTFTGNIGVAGNITNASGDLTLDVAGDIILDSGGYDVRLKVDGTEYAKFSNYQNNFYLEPIAQDKDLIIRGNDGGSVITALTLDMSEAGAATFAGDVTLAASKNLTITSGQLQLGANYRVLWGGSNDYSIMSDNSNYVQINADGEDGLRVANTESTFNEGGIDRDFRVESDSFANMLFVDAGSNSVGVKMGTPASYLATEFVVGCGDEGGITLAALSGSTKQNIYFADGTSGSARNRGNLSYDHVNDSLSMGTSSGSSRFLMDSTGAVTFSSTITAGANSGVIKEIGSDLSLIQGAVGLRINDAASAISATTATANSDGAVDLGVSNIRFKRLYLTDGITDSGSAGSNTVFNEDGTTADFRVESDSNANMLFVDGGNNRVGVGVVPDVPLHVYTNSGVDTTVELLRLDCGDTTHQGGKGGKIRFTDISVYNSTAEIIARREGVSGNSHLEFSLRDTVRLGLFSDGSFTTTPAAGGHAVFNEGGVDADFRVESDGNANCFKIDASGDSGQGVVLFGQNIADSSSNGGYFALGSNNGHLVVANTQATNALALIYLNRQNSDGTLMEFRKGDNSKGSISVSGATVSFNGFSGRHESSGISANTPIGTVVSTIDELDVYPNTSKDTEGNVVTNPEAGQTRADHAKVEVSTSVGDPCVYGVVSEFDNNGKLIVTSVGIGSVRVTGSCAKGDLLESNGDGTAKVQSDDIIRSKTIGKVTIGNSNTGVKLVSCVMYCG